MIKSLDHIHIYASDPSATIAFYTELFGAEKLGILPNTQNHFLILGGQYLVVSGFPEGMEPKTEPDVGDGALHAGFGVAHFGLQTSHLECMIARLRSAGVNVHSDARGEGAIRYVYVSAPDGVVLELVQLNLPKKLKRLLPLLHGVDKTIHLTKRALAKQLFK